MGQKQETGPKKQDRLEPSRRGDLLAERNPCKERKKAKNKGRKELPDKENEDKSGKNAVCFEKTSHFSRKIGQQAEQDL